MYKSLLLLCHSYRGRDFDSKERITNFTSFTLGIPDYLPMGNGINFNNNDSAF